ncbi:MAG: hypothetical protein ACREMV_03340 [Gemmatimonadales bacterium]
MQRYKAGVWVFGMVTFVGALTDNPPLFWLGFFVAVALWWIGRDTRRGATTSVPAPAPREMIRLTLTEPEARMFRALLVLGSRAMWPDHVRRGVEATHRKELEKLASFMPGTQVLDTASFYWAQLSSWLRDRKPVGTVSAGATP